MVESSLTKTKRAKATCLDCNKILSDLRKKRCKSCYHTSRRGIPTWNKGLSKKNHNSLKIISENMKINNPMFKKENVEKMRQEQIGNKYRWKGGRFNIKQGVMIHMPEHPNSNTVGQIFEHRVMAEKKIKRKLSSEDIIHHIDGDNKNNSRENLMITTRSNHARIHDSERVRDEFGRYL